MEGSLKAFVASLVKDGVFGNVKLLRLKPDSETEVGLQFSSTIAFVNLTVEGLKENVIPIVIKIPFDDMETRLARNTNSMFHNEVSMYKEILPILGLDEIRYPKIHYGNTSSRNDSEIDILILENMKYKGFELSKERVFLDLEHITLVIKNIAEFHALSYIHKDKNKNDFFKMTKTLKDVVLSKEKEEEYRAISVASIERGINLVLNNEARGDILIKCLNLLKDPYKIKRFLSSPEEPLAVICHGDFCNNNILYRYDRSGKPIDCVFLDFQMCQYASPAIDLFYFMYMHTSSDLRNNHWEDLLKMYWDTLRLTVPRSIEIPSLEDHLRHFGKRAVYGYITCSWFIPAMSDNYSTTMNDYKSWSLEEKISYFMSLGGEKGGQLISEVVLHLLNKGYLMEFLEFCKEKNI